MTKYKLAGERLEESGVIRIADGAAIPADEGNRDWRAFLEWQNEGNTPDPQFTPEEEVEKIKNQQISDLQQDLINTDQALLKLVIFMYHIGKEKGIWNKADFESIAPGIVDKVQLLKEKLDQKEVLETT